MNFEQNKQIQDLVNKGDHLSVEDPGMDPEADLVKKGFNPRLLEGLDEEDKGFAKLHLTHLQSFLQNPIITDDFHGDRVGRFNSEKQHEKDSSQARLAFNRLRATKITGAVGALSILQILVTDGVIKDKLSELYQKIPPIFFEKEVEEECKEEGVCSKYLKLEDNPKIKAVMELTEIVKEALTLLEEE
jgi:hypothetical protein